MHPCSVNQSYFLANLLGKKITHHTCFVQEIVLSGAFSFSLRSPLSSSLPGFSGFHPLSSAFHPIAFDDYVTCPSLTRNPLTHLLTCRNAETSTPQPPQKHQRPPGSSAKTAAPLESLGARIILESLHQEILCVSEPLGGGVGDDVLVEKRRS